MDSQPSQPAAKTRNLIIAIAAIILAAALFFGIKLDSQGNSLGALAKTATSYEVAIASDKPTMIEFYADWCASCQAMAKDNLALEREYGDRVNFVMLNVDNNKWLPELEQYNVDGIPEFVFLDGAKNTQGTAIGTVPKQIMAENLEALIAGNDLPHAQLVDGNASQFNAPKPADNTAPRDHG
ncbi:Thioredoxin domain-containing protein [Thalassoporum mexicanum PCC 7367]|uniref:thioredoxin domain-containing protein n=1 Tax=Thalassoporum mexicanum TaxID=3457544 RepID=UPI00029FF37A|nr:thioredoxin domain-containing protein [Pseudanabaena sp. PCC 7367]AFY68842.1 Thioredoxin domain-containing protein [Pseudanabaena sp. PCC 7367]